MFPVAVLAGGLGTRLYPVTQRIPKALIDVAGMPFIFRQLNYMRHQGIDDVVLCIGNLGHMIRDAVGDGQEFGLRVRYSSDGPNLLGTGGAIMKAMPLLGNEFFVLYGDSFLPINFSDVQLAYKRSNKNALMTVLQNYSQWDSSNLLYNRGIVVEYNKFKPRPEMAHIDYGLSILSSSIFNKFSTGCPFDLADIYQDLSMRGQLAAFEVYERFYEIGSPNGLNDTIEYFLSNDPT